MSIGFPHKATAHLAEAIGTGDTSIVIHQMEYGPILSAQGDEVYLLFRGPVNRELVKIDISASVWGQYLTIARGQGGTTAKAWPLGSMLFSSTHADFYNAIIQRGENRIVDYNPNEVLAPLYAGEEIYQSGPAGCERWWKSFNGVNSYWDIITGAACSQEEYTDIGWDYDLLKSSAPPAETQVLTVYAEDGDGAVISFGAGWSNVRDTGDGLVAYPTFANSDVGAGARDMGSGNYVVGRAFFEFDLTNFTITDRTITKIELDLCAFGYTESDVMLFGSNFTGAVSTSDFLDFLSTALLAAEFTMDMWDGGDYKRNLLQLNAAGETYVINNFDGLVSFCLREYTHDVLDSAPTGNERNGLWFLDFGYTDPLRTPRLKITYDKSPVWVQHLSDWTILNGASWDGSKYTSSGGLVELEANAWASGYKPYKIKIEFAGEATAWIEMYNTDGSGELFDGRNEISSNDEILIDNYHNFDMDTLLIYISGTVTDIQFLDP